MKEPNKEIENYSRAIELDPKNPRIYNQRGNFFHELKNYQEAIADYTKAIELSPGNAGFYNNLGICYKDDKQYDKAIEYFNKAIEINPDDENTYYNKGIYYQNLELYELAIENYNKAIEIKSEHADAYTNRGVIYCELKLYEKAIADYNTALKLNPEDEIVYNNLGSVYSLLDEKDKSLECLKISFKKGFRDFKGIEEDADYDNIRDTIEYKSLISNAFFQNDTFLGKNFLVRFNDGQLCLMKGQLGVFPLILRNIELKFSDMLHHYKVTLSEHFVMCVIDYGHSLSPKKLAKETASLGKGDFRGEYSEPDYLDSIESCINKGLLRLLKATKLSNPELEEGSVDFTETGYMLHREIIKTIFGERVLKYNDSGWDINRKKNEIHIYAETQDLCQQRTQELIDHTERYLGEEVKVVSFNNYDKIEIWKPNQFMSLRGFRNIIKYAT